jgi:hypothetical protein
MPSFLPISSLNILQVEVQASNTSARRGTSKAERDAVRSQSLSTGTMQKAGTVKRDRRTIEEIQRDNKRRREGS